MTQNQQYYQPVPEQYIPEELYPQNEQYPQQIPNNQQPKRKKKINTQATKKPKKRIRIHIPKRPKKSIVTVDMLSALEYKAYRITGKKKNQEFIKSVFNLIVFIIPLIMIIYLRILQTELNADYESMTSQLNVLTSENVRLQVKLEAELSNDAIEQIAREIGMEELSNSNIEYISFNPVAKAQVMDTGNIFDKIVNWCEDFVLSFHM